jgi:hypothetical protein
LKVASDANDATAAVLCSRHVGFFSRKLPILILTDVGAGFNFSNLGPKIGYDNDDVNNNFIPANLKLGTGFDFILDDFNKVALNVEFNKLLVPYFSKKDDLNAMVLLPEEANQNLEITDRSDGLGILNHLVMHRRNE